MIPHRLYKMFGFRFGVPPTRDSWPTTDGLPTRMSTCWFALVPKHLEVSRTVFRSVGWQGMLPSCDLLLSFLAEERRNLSSKRLQKRALGIGHWFGFFTWGDLFFGF